MRVLRLLVLVVLLVSVVLLSAGVWLAGTRSGLQVLWQTLLAPAVPELTIGKVEGRLAGTLQLQQVQYRDAHTLFAAQSLQLDWRPAALLHGVLRVTSLAAAGVRYENLASSSANEPLALPHSLQLPLDLVLQALSVSGISVRSSPQSAPLQIESVTLDGSWRGEQLQLRRFALQLPDGSASGALSIQTAQAYPLQGDVHWQAVLPDYAPLQADTRITGTLQALRLQQTLAAPYAAQLDLRLQDVLNTLQLDGSVVLQDSDLAAIHAGWPDMRLAGMLAAQGLPEDLHFNGRLALRDATVGTAQLELAGQYRPDAVQFDSVQLTSDGRPLRLDAQGRIGLGDSAVFDFTAQWQALGWPLDGKPDWSSRSGHVALTGTADHYRVDARGDLQWQDLLKGELDVLAASGPTPGNWTIERASLQGGRSRVTASGQAGQLFALDWKVDAPKLADLSPRARGSLQASGRFSGAWPEAALQISASGHAIEVQDYQLGALSINGNVDAGKGRTSRLQATLDDATLGNTRISHLAFSGAGTTLQHHASLQADTSQGKVDMALDGHWDGSSWRFDLQQAQLAYPSLAPWQLQQPVSGVLAGDRLQLPEHCWNSPPARACLQFAGNATDYQGKLTLAGLPFDYLDTLLPDTLRLQGELNGEGTFSATARTPPVLHARLDSTPVQLTLSQADAQPAFGFAPGQAVLDVEKRKASVSVDLPLASGQGGLRLQGTLAAPASNDWLQGILQGELNLHWPDIGLARHWVPELAELQGQVDGQVHINGTPENPRLQGRLELAHASARLATPGIRLEDVSLLLSGQDSGLIRVTAQAHSGSGSLQGEGVFDAQSRNGSLHLVGTDFQVMNTPEAKIDASPDLQLEITTQQADITGQITIPRAQLRPTRPPPDAVSVSPDQVIVTEHAAQGATPRYAVNSRIRVVLGDAVDIDGLGLSGKLRGNVQVTAPPGQPTRANGELSIRDGRYEAYGQQLTITTGRLLFAGGAVTEPGLDLEAVRTPAKDIKVGVRARGSLRAPTFTVFSEPSMPQSEQLSWLVLGRSMQGGASTSERSALQSAALLLGLNQGDSIGKQVGETLGLDEVSVGTTEGGDINQASLLVGKYLTPELFVSYGIGLFEQVATLQIRYALSSRWKLVGETAGQTSSADLFYEIERRK